MRNNHLATLAQGVSLGVSNLAFSLMVWTCNVADAWETSFWDEGFVEIPLRVDFLPKHTGYQPVHGQKY